MDDLLEMGPRGDHRSGSAMASEQLRELFLSSCFSFTAAFEEQALPPGRRRGHCQPVNESLSDDYPATKLSQASRQLDCRRVLLGCFSFSLLLLLFLVLFLGGGYRGALDEATEDPTNQMPRILVIFQWLLKGSQQSEKGGEEGAGWDGVPLERGRGRGRSRGFPTGGFQKRRQKREAGGGQRLLLQAVGISSVVERRLYH